MILSALLVAASLPRWIEAPDPTAKKAIIVGIVRAPEFSGDELIRWRILGESLLAGTKKYDAATIERYGSQAGERPEVRVLKDHLLIRLSSPKDGVGLCVSILASLLREPLLEQPSMDRILATLQRMESDPNRFRTNEWPQLPKSVSSKAMMSLARKAFTSSSLTITVGGDYDRQEFFRAVKDQFEDWKAKRPTYEPEGNPPKPQRPAQGLQSIVIASQLVTKTEDISPGMLSALVLGTGKCSSVHRICREKMGWSYWQESWLVPRIKGLEVSLVALHSPLESDKITSDEIRKALFDDVESWTEADRLRGIALAKSNLEHVIPLDPLGRLADPTIWAAYADQWGIQSPKSILECLDMVTLDALKASAKSILGH